MLTRVDRLQLAVPDRSAAARGWTDILGAVHDRDDRVDALGARRSSYRLGAGFVELLEPDGAGPIAVAISRRGPHLFAGGVATPEIGAVASRLRSKGMDVEVSDGQLHLSAYGVPLVVSAEEAALDPVGLVDTLYEITDLRADHRAAVARYADLFALDTSAFVPISSSGYGYEGVLTLFHDARLHRLEVITANDADKTMGRFHSKWGDVLYMCYVEVPDVGAIHHRAAELNAPNTANLPDGMFLHPGALGGVMLGVSRRTVAWSWSGHPERVQGA